MNINIVIKSTLKRPVNNKIESIKPEYSRSKYFQPIKLTAFREYTTPL